MTDRDPGEPLNKDVPTEALPAATEIPAEAGAWPAETAPPITTERVQGPARGRRARWVVALVAGALVITTALAAAFIMTGKAPDATVLGWVPSGSVVYAEVRLDLPGDQRAKLGEFLSKFPGFRDQASLDTKLDETFDRLISAASDGEQTYTADISPWFGGEIAMSVSSLPDMSAMTDMTDPSSMWASPGGIFFVSVTDEAKARAWLADLVKAEASTTETYAGTELTIVGPATGGDARRFGYAIGGGKVLVLGTVAGVKSALDTQGAGGLAADAGFAAALRESGKDHVGFMYLNLRTYMEWALSMSEMPGMGEADMCGATLSEDMQDLIPEWVGVNLRVEGDALTQTAAVPMPAEPIVEQQNRASKLAARVPSSTIAFIEGHDVGASLLASLEQYRKDPACAEALKEIESTADIVGGLDHLLGWMGDEAVVVNRTGDGVEAGIVVQTADAETARSLDTMLRGGLGFIGGEAGISIREETHGDATIQIVDLGDAAQLFALSGMSAGVSIPPPGGPGSHIEIAWTVTDDLVVIGVGPSFVKHILDTDQATSLASDARFNALLERAGKDNVGVVYTDVTAIRELFEGVAKVHAAEYAEYETEYRPFLLPFDAYMMSSVVGSDVGRTNAIITIK